MFLIFIHILAQLMCCLLGIDRLMNVVSDYRGWRCYLLERMISIVQRPHDFLPGFYTYLIQVCLFLHHCNEGWYVFVARQLNNNLQWSVFCNKNYNLFVRALVC